MREKTMRLEGKVAIDHRRRVRDGRQHGADLCPEGAKVVVADQLDDEGKKIVAEIVTGQRRGELSPPRRDRRGDWKRVVAATVAEFGRLDILVNNAGISGSAVDDLSTRRLGQDHGRQRARRVFRDEVRDPRDAQSRRRVDRQHLVDLRRHRPARHPRRLQRLERRDPHDDQGRRGAARPAQHPRQLGASRA